jgi:Transposase DDE domain
LLIQGYFLFGRMAMSGEWLGSFGDARHGATGAYFLERAVAVGTLVVRQIGETRSGEIRVHRFLDSPKVTVEEILRTAGSRTQQACVGRRIVAATDTTEVNFAGRDKKRRGLGAAGDGQSRGFFIHAMVAVDADEDALLGAVNAQIWTRTDGGSRLKERPYEDKESYRWLKAMEQAEKGLKGAAEIIVVEDREGDIYPQFARRPKGLHLIVRAAQNRKTDDGLLFDVPAIWAELGQQSVTIQPQKTGEKPREAMVAIRAGAVVIRQPANATEAGDPPSLMLNLVEAREIGDQAKPVLWRLLTTLPVDGFDQAAEVVRLYRLRWRIEQVFRALKSDGMQIEDTQIHDAAKLFKLAAIGIIAAARTIQLVDARDGSSRPATDVIDPSMLDAARAINKKKQGKTARQQNAHPEGSLAWLAWIIARLGGWNCYYKPPGPKTMRRGWDQFAAMACGFTIAKEDL